MQLERQALADVGHWSAHWGAFIGCDAKNAASRKAVLTAPNETMLEINVFEIADERHTEVAAWGDDGPTSFSVIRGAERFDKVIELDRAQQVVEL